MSRDPLARMDVDTRWAYHRKLRKLQHLYPRDWPTYWTAYLALLGEAWAAGKRSLTLEQTWVPAMPCTPEEAFEALHAADIVDGKGRVPPDSWREWYEPVEKRLKGRSMAGQEAAHNRWHDGPFVGCERCADAMRSHSQRNAPRPPRHPHPPRDARPPAREATGLSTRKNGKPEPIAATVRQVADELLTPELRAAMAFAEERGRR